MHVTEDGPYAARVRDVLEAFGVSVALENVGVLAADSPRLREPERIIADRHRLTVLLVSEALELFTALHGPGSHEFLRRLAGVPDRCLMAVLDETHVVELAPLQATAVQNRLRDPSELVVAIKHRLDSMVVSDQRPPSPDAGSPVDDHGAGADLAEIIKHKPAGWRTTLQAAAMVDELRRLEPKRQEHDHGRRVAGLQFGRYEASNFLQGTVLPDLESFLEKFTRQIASIQGNAASDADRVERSARDLVVVAEDLLDWAARIRGAEVPRRWSAMVQRAAALSDSLLASVDEFVDAYAREADRLRNDPDYDGTGISITLTFDLDSRLLDELLEDYKKVHRG